MNLSEMVVLVALVSSMIVGYVIGYIVSMSKVEEMCEVACILARAGERERVNAKWQSAVKRSYVEMNTKLEDLP